MLLSYLKKFYRSVLNHRIYNVINSKIEVIFYIVFSVRDTLVRIIRIISSCEELCRNIVERHAGTKSNSWTSLFQNKFHFCRISEKMCKILTLPKIIPERLYHSVNVAMKTWLVDQLNHLKRYFFIYCSQRNHHHPLSVGCTVCKHRLVLSFTSDNASYKLHLFMGLINPRRNETKAKSVLLAPTQGIWTLKMDTYVRKILSGSYVLSNFWNHESARCSNYWIQNLSNQFKTVTTMGKDFVW